ncbi:MAG: hypothetical protein ACXV3F_12095 [Frankiaceae bacterium]
MTGDVFLGGATVEGDVDLLGATVKGEASLGPMTLGGNLFSEGGVHPARKSGSNR